MVEYLPSVSIEGRLSFMAKQVQHSANFLQGVPDMLNLRTILYGHAHSHQIGKHIQRTTNDFLQMYTDRFILHCTDWSGEGRSEIAPDCNWEFKYYRLTEMGKKQLVVEESQRKQMAEGVALVMWPVVVEN